jgi:hypothetical protein
MTIDKIDISKLNEEQKDLATKLNCTTNYSEEKPKGSIMHFGQLCEHDTGFLCEHRLEYILGYVKHNKL